jgi:putative sigma-54 modulation protein
LKGVAGLHVSVTFRHVDSSEPLRDYAVDKVSRTCAKYLRDPIEAHVVLSVVKVQHRAEITVHAKHFDLAAHEDTDDLYEAIDLAVDRVEAQLRKHKDRINDHKGRAGEVRTVPVDVIEFDESEGDSGRRVIETDNIPAKPLSIYDAILQLELNHAEFLVFWNSGTESISVIYKRRDGNYGLITPNR